MKLSEFIDKLQRYQDNIGDVELFAEENDGRVTSAVPASPTIQFREIWKDHSAGRRYFISIC